MNWSLEGGESCCIIIILKFLLSLIYNSCIDHLNCRGLLNCRSLIKNVSLTPSICLIIHKNRFSCCHGRRNFSSLPPWNAPDNFDTWLTFDVHSLPLRLFMWGTGSVVWSGLTLYLPPPPFFVEWVWNAWGGEPLQLGPGVARGRREEGMTLRW